MLSIIEVAHAIDSAMKKESDDGDEDHDRFIAPMLYEFSYVFHNRKYVLLNFVYWMDG